MYMNFERVQLKNVQIGTISQQFIVNLFCTKLFVIDQNYFITCEAEYFNIYSGLFHTVQIVENYDLGTIIMSICGYITKKDGRIERKKRYNRILLKSCFFTFNSSFASKQNYVITKRVFMVYFAVPQFLRQRHVVIESTLNYGQKILR